MDQWLQQGQLIDLLIFGMLHTEKKGNWFRGLVAIMALLMRLFSILTLNMLISWPLVALIRPYILVNFNDYIIKS
jgi:hypothetical protein